ncbi:MAG: hypothetical protein J6M60_03125 [Clostridia bacterium]|nr:hypothetical protein [Clostridia bacterium]
MTEGLLGSIETVEPGEFKTGVVIEITSKIEGRLVVNRYYLSEENTKMSEEIAEFPVIHKKNRKNILNFIEAVRSKFSEEDIYIDRTTKETLKKVM